MFDYLKGTVAEKTENTMTLEVSGIGFELFATQSAFNKFAIGENAKVFTYMSVREDGVSLFGFASKEEKRLFNKLIAVSGVGPKSAIGILSGAPIENIIFCIATGDSKTLSKIKGLGKRTAEKIIVELRDKVAESAGDEIFELKSEIPAINGDVGEAIKGLMSLGFTKQEAENGVKKAIEEGADGLEGIISLAIKRML